MGLLEYTNINSLTPTASFESIGHVLFMHPLIKYSLAHLLRGKCPVPHLTIIDRPSWLMVMMIMMMMTMKTTMMMMTMMM